MNKGFTLVELLAVLVILSIVAMLVFPAISEILSESRQVVENAQIDKILDSAYDYSIANSRILPEYGSTVYITLNELKKENLVDSNITDTSTMKLFPENLVISIKNVGSNYRNQFSYSKVRGYYLYRVESEFMNTAEFESRKPIIKFSGYDTSPIVVSLNIGEEYIPLEYISTSIDGEDLTDKVIENIVHDSKSVDYVDTAKPGIYYINYSVIDNNGYSNYSTVNIIVNDNEKPILTIPGNETIDLSVNSYNLMDGVSCSDNSGICDISVNGKISYGVAGKYIIEYSAFDETGNTTILKRVITIE